MLKSEFYIRKEVTVLVRINLVACLLNRDGKLNNRRETNCTPARSVMMKAIALKKTLSLNLHTVIKLLVTLDLYAFTTLTDSS